MNKKHVVLIGAGQLGSRHLQGLLKAEQSAIIDVFDLNEDSLETAKSRAGEVDDINSQSEVHYFKSFTNLKEKYDVAIIATTASVRGLVTKQLLEQSTVDTILFEKVLFQTEKEYIEIEALLKSRNVRAYVNCPRRLANFYQDIKPRISSSDSSMTVSGGSWGMACNSIHFIDLFAFLTDSRVEGIDTSLLESLPVEGKRDGYYECFGKMVVKFSKNNSLVLDCRRDSRIISVNIDSKNLNANVFETKGEAEVRDSENSWTSNKEKYFLDFQSNLSNKFLDDVSNNRDVNLTDFAEAKELHTPLINSLIDYFIGENVISKRVCPIT